MFMEGWRIYVACALISAASFNLTVTGVDGDYLIISVIRTRN